MMSLGRAVLTTESSLPFSVKNYEKFPLNVSGPNTRFRSFSFGLYAVVLYITAPDAGIFTVVTSSTISPIR